MTPRIFPMTTADDEAKIAAIRANPLYTRDAAGNVVAVESERFLLRMLDEARGNPTAGMIAWEGTSRGFGRGEFYDRYGVRCSIQSSSIATEDCIWLGADESIGDAERRRGRTVIEGATHNQRMHLTREMARELADHLLRFYYTGSVAPEAPDEEGEDEE